jgi:hypothetical protein
MGTATTTDTTPATTTQSTTTRTTTTHPYHERPIPLGPRAPWRVRVRSGASTGAGKRRPTLVYCVKIHAGGTP